MADEKIRAFVALDLPKEAINEIKRAQEIIKKKKLFEGKFVEEENLHLTLKFLGEIDKEKLEKVKKKLGEINLKSFEAELGGIGAFPSKYESYLRVIWVKLNYCEELQKKIDESLEGLFEKEHRFMGHITIARVKKVYDKKELLDYLNKIKIKKIRFKVGRFFLKKSELFSESPIYEILSFYCFSDSQN